jgi:DNA repair exonuclease SbcCD ATPase subunit
MLLRSIRLKNFKRFDDFQAQFSPGINVVKGSLNEIGKSTLLEGIIAALFYNPKSSSGAISKYTSWSSTRRYETALEFEEEGDRYLSEKDFEKGAVRLICHDTKEELDTFKKISERLEELLGTNSERLFLCTSCIRQDEVSEISSGKKEISDSLEEVMTGGEENVLASQVIQKLDKKLSDMKKGLAGMAKSPGILKSLKNRIDSILQRLEEVKAQLSVVEARKIELVETDEELVGIIAEYKNLKALLEKNKQRKELEENIEKFTTSYDETEQLVKEVNNLIAGLERADESLKAIEGIENRQQISEFRSKLAGFKIRQNDIENHLLSRENEIAGAKEQLNKKGLLKFLSSRQFTIFSAAAIIIVIGLILIAIAMWAKSKLTQERTKISELEERIQSMREFLEELDKEEKELLAQTRCKTIDEFDEKEKDFSRWLGEKMQFEAQLKGRLGGKTIEEIEEKRQEMARNLAVEQAKLTEDLKATALSPEKYIELEGKAEGLEARQTELENRKRDCKAAIKYAKFDAEEQIKFEEELESLQESLKREEYKVSVYELAREFISRARTEVFSSATETLEKEIQKNLAVFTNGKYDQVKVNKENLEFWTYSKEKDDWVKPEELSGGVIDEFYLASRLALVKLIFGDKKPPLILDDPFGNFDAVRLAKTLEFFRQLDDDYQIIIFTFKDSYDEVASNVIILD